MDCSTQRSKYRPLRDRIPLPSVTLNRGLRSTLFKIVAAVEIEFRLLRAERSLIILIPLVILLSIFDLAFFRVEPEISYSVTYASGTAKVLLLFLSGPDHFLHWRSDASRSRSEGPNRLYGPRLRQTVSYCSQSVSLRRCWRLRCWR